MNNKFNLLLFCFLTIITTCTKDSTSPNDNDNGDNGEISYTITSEKTIDGAGGTLTEPNSNVSIIVPQGALDSSVKLEVGPAVNVPIDANVHLPDASYHFGPDGQDFNKSVLMTIPYDPSNIPNNVQESSLQIHFYDKYTDTWSTVGDSINTQTNEVYGNVDHFCFFNPGGNIAPNPVTLNEPTNPTGNSITLSWTQNVDADFHSYRIYYSTTASVTNQSTLAATITNQNQSTHTVTNLQPQTPYYFVVYVYDTGDLNNKSNEKTKTTTEQVNTTPTASFTVDPTSGTTATVFNFDASGCADNEDPTSALQVRWDWENDETWDTDYSTNKTTTHQFTNEGTYTVKMEVKDTSSLTHSVLVQIIVMIPIQYTGTMTDIDGNIYNTIQIGDQLWMAENLKVTHYRNGESIPIFTNETEWLNLGYWSSGYFYGTGAYCNYDNDENYVLTYGRLYSWFAVVDLRGLAPQGWHVPSDEEWKQLEMFLGMSQSEINNTGLRGSDQGSKLKSRSGWYGGGNGTNSSGFSALPGGGYGWGFINMEYSAVFWTTTSGGYYGVGDSSLNRALVYDNDGVSRGYMNRLIAASVRCIKD